MTPGKVPGHQSLQSYVTTQIGLESGPQRPSIAQHRTDLMTTTDHLLAAVPEFSSICPTRCSPSALHQQEHTHKAPQQTTFSPEQVQRLQQKGSEPKFASTAAV